jgi:hypothetical protein
MLRDVYVWYDLRCVKLVEENAIHFVKVSSASPMCPSIHAKKQQVNSATCPSIHVENQEPPHA